MNDPDFILYSDGGARGNPGPAAYGFAVHDASGETLIERGGAMGETTNNVAEYTGVIEGLKAIRAHVGKVQAKHTAVECRMDSELVVKQMNGIYKIKGENMIPLFVALWNLKQDFASVRFVHIPREKNQQADRMVNEALDAIPKNLGI